MGLCDTCKQPGACCRDIPIYVGRSWGNFFPRDWPERAAAELAQKLPGHPFIPLRLEIFPEDQIIGTDPYGAGRWSCSNLTPEGRCGDYENRPELCRNYEAGSDRLCVMYVPPAEVQP